MTHHQFVCVEKCDALKCYIENLAFTACCIASDFVSPLDTNNKHRPHRRWRAVRSPGRRPATSAAPSRWPRRSKDGVHTGATGSAGTGWPPSGRENSPPWPSHLETKGNANTIYTWAYVKPEASRGHWDRRKFASKTDSSHIRSKRKYAAALHCALRC